MKRKTIASSMIVCLALLGLSIVPLAGKTVAGGITGTNTNLARLKEARTWMYQIQGLDRRGAITALSKTDYPLLVLEPTLTVKGDEDFNTKRMLQRLRWTPGGKRRVILAYDDDTVKAKARRGHINAAREMVTFIRRMRRSGRKAERNFLVVGQNAAYLINKDAGYARLIDALAVEDTWFRGEADAGWKNPDGGDIKNRRHDKYSTRSLLRQYRKYARANVPVFSVDYCLKPGNASRVYDLAAINGLRALVTRVSLSRVTRTPPP